MTEEVNNPQSKAQEAAQKPSSEFESKEKDTPDLNVKAPKYINLSEGYNPDQEN